MKYSLVAAALVAAVSAQSISDIPTCAIPCIDASVSSKTSCSKTDVACICKNFEAVQADAMSCVLSKCGAETAVNEVLPATKKLCSSPPKVEESSKAPMSSAAAETSAAAEPSKAPESTKAPESSMAPETTVVAPVTTKSAAVTTSFATMTPSANGTSGGQPPAKTSGPATAGAAVIGSMGAFAMMALGALAL